MFVLNKHTLLYFLFYKIQIVRLNISAMKDMRQKDGQSGRCGKVRRLVRLNSKITRLSSELETLQFLQDRLERELAPADRGEARDWKQSPVKMRANRRAS